MCFTQGICRTALPLMCLLITISSMADELRLNNGDRISGTLQYANARAVVIDSGQLGKVKLNRERVAAITTQRPVSVTFKNHDQLTGKLSLNQAGEPRFQSRRFGNIIPFDLADIQTIRRLGITNAATLSKPANGSRAKPSIKADVLKLNTGDTLVGAIERVDADDVMINTDFGGEMTIDKGKVASLRTAKPVTVVFTGDKYLTGRIAPGPGDTMQVKTEQAGESKVFTLSDVKSVYRGSPTKIAREAEAAKLTGGVNLGLDTTNGNSDTQAYVGSAMLQARTPENRYTARLDATYQKADGSTTEDDDYALLKYDHFLTDKVFLFNSASFARDQIQGINLRSTLAAGAGYQFFESDDLFLYADAGPAFVNEDLDGEDDQYGSGRWSVDYHQLLLNWVTLFHNQEANIGLTDTGKFNLRTQTGLRFPLGNGLNATAQANVEYLRNPPQGAKSTDREYLVTLGYGF